MAAVKRIALVGAGNMGAHHARVISQSDQATLAVLVDPRESVGRAMAERLGASWAPELPDLHDIDAVVVAAATEAHYGLAVEVLSQDRPLLIEKPVADDLLHTREILELAEARDVPIMCGLLERYNPAVAHRSRRARGARPHHRDPALALRPAHPHRCRVGPPRARRRPRDQPHRLGADERRLAPRLLPPQLRDRRGGRRRDPARVRRRADRPHLGEPRRPAQDPHAVDLRTRPTDRGRPPPARRHDLPARLRGLHRRRTLATASRRSSRSPRSSRRPSR